MAILKTLTVNGETYTVVPLVPAASVTLLASDWVSNDGDYSQVVELEGVTSDTKVDLQPTPEQVAIFYHKTLAFVAENKDGVVTVYSIGDKPENDYTIQVTMTEVDHEGAIRGNTVGLPNPQADWNQTDPTKADYIKNKPDIKDGVTSWNDLTDKPFGAVGEDTEIFPATPLPFQFDGALGTVSVSPSPIVLIDGETYRVVYDGEEHELVCFSQNGALLLIHSELDDNGDPTDGTFAISYNPTLETGGTAVVIINDSTSTANHTFALYHMSIKKLDVKYLPMDAIMASVDARIDAYIAEALGGEF